MKMRRNPNCKCKICNKAVYRRPFQVEGGNVYCSRQCTGLDQRNNKACPICSNTYVGAKKTCSRACANKARKGIKYTKEGKFNMAYRGRATKEKLATLRGGKCERCSENNYAILQVHHKEERHKGGTDKLANLELLCPNCHALHHFGKSLFQNKKNAKVATTNT